MAARLGLILALSIGCEDGIVPLSPGQGAPAIRDPDTPTLVRIDEGLVRGVVEDGTLVWRGIPFAAPPAGDLRWSLPQPPAHWTGERDASNFGPICRQRQQGVFLGDEDCLTLDIYAPEGAAEQLPVLIWIHGGSRINGSGRIPAHALAQRGMVVVTVQYRLGALGFLGHAGFTAESGTSGNWGLFDLVAALEWVRHEIDRFGGDPRRITLAGQSSGASNINAMLASPLSRHRFQGAVLMSNSIEPGETRPLAESEAAGADLAARLGCDGTDAEQVACLRALPADVLLSARLPTPPVRFVIDDGFFVDGDVALTLKRHGAGVPVIIGGTRDEAATAHDLTPIGADDFTAAVEAEFPTVADQILPLYPLASYASPLSALIAVESDGFSICLFRLLAQELSLAHRARPVYRYLFTHSVEGDPSLAAFGAYHAEDIAFVFGDFEREFGDGYVPTAAELALSDSMQSAFARFVVTGDPGWPAYSLSNDNFLQFDDSVALGSGYHAAACNILAPRY